MGLSNRTWARHSLHWLHISKHLHRINNTSGFSRLANYPVSPYLALSYTRGRPIALFSNTVGWPRQNHSHCDLQSNTPASLLKDQAWVKLPSFAVAAETIPIKSASPPLLHTIYKPENETTNRPNQKANKDEQRGDSPTASDEDRPWHGAGHIGIGPCIPITLLAAEHEL